MMSVYQIWGSFEKGDRDNPTTIDTFQKGQKLSNGMLTEDFEKKFADEEGEEYVLLEEFDVIEHLADRDIHEHMPSPEMEAALAAMYAEAFMNGWWKKGGDDDTDSEDEPRTA